MNEYEVRRKLPAQRGAVHQERMMRAEARRAVLAGRTAAGWTPGTTIPLSDLADRGAGDLLTEFLRMTRTNGIDPPDAVAHTPTPPRYHPTAGSLPATARAWTVRGPSKGFVLLTPAAHLAVGVHPQGTRTRLVNDRARNGVHSVAMYGVNHPAHRLTEEEVGEWIATACERLGFSR